MAKRADKNPSVADGRTVEIVTRTTERRTGEDEEIDLTGAEVATEEQDVMAALAELDGAAARLEIRRTSPVEFAGYVGTYGSEGFSPDTLYQEWGGGKYTIRVRMADGTMRGTRHVQIAGKPKNKEEPPAAAQATAAAPQSDAMAQILAGIQASNAAAAEATKSQIGLLTTLLTTLITKEAPKPPAAPDPLAMLEKAATILRPRGESSGGMEMFLKGIELGKTFGEGGGEGPNMGSLFLEGVKAIKETAALSAARPAPRRIAPPGTVPAQATPAVAPPAPNNQGEAVQLPDKIKAVNWIKQQAAFLVIQASREKNPALYAELFLDNLPSFLPEADVLEQMQKADAIANLSLLNAEVLKYPEWFEQFRVAVVEMLAEPDDLPQVLPAHQVIDGGTEGEGGE